MILLKATSTTIRSTTLTQLARLVIDVRLERKLLLLRGSLRLQCCLGCLTIDCKGMEFLMETCDISEAFKVCVSMGIKLE